MSTTPRNLTPSAQAALAADAWQAASDALAAATDDVEQLRDEVVRAHERAVLAHRESEALAALPPEPAGRR